MKTVIDAVNRFKGVFPVGGYSTLIVAKFDFDDYKAGDFKISSLNASNRYWKVICTEEEFNQCVKELSEAKLMSKPVYTQEMKDRGELPSVGMECISYGNRVVILLDADKQGDFVTMNANGIYEFNAIEDINPIDTRTDKEKAIDNLIEVFGSSSSRSWEMLSLAYDKWVGES